MTRKYLWGITLITFAIIGFFIPFMILYFTKYDEWVVTAEGTEVTIGVIIGLIYGVMVLAGALKSLSKSFVTLVSMFAFLIIVWFLDSILNDLFWIILSFIVGFVIFLIFKTWGKRQIDLAKAYGDETYRVKARQAAESSATPSSLRAIK